jgi:hypothetical protein
MSLDEHAMTELELFIDNDGDLYRQKTQPIEKNLYLKMAKGTYSKSLAPKLWGYLVEEGAKKYAKDFGGVWNVSFPKRERDALAERYARRFENAVRGGEYEHLRKTLPKKYQASYVDERGHRGLSAEAKNVLEQIKKFGPWKARGPGEEIGTDIRRELRGMLVFDPDGEVRLTERGWKVVGR